MSAVSSAPAKWTSPRASWMHRQPRTLTRPAQRKCTVTFGYGLCLRLTARSAAARGLLPLPQADLLEALVHLSADNDSAIAQAAQETLASQDASELQQIAATEATAPAVLGYLASLSTAAREIHEAIA